MKVLKPSVSLEKNLNTETIMKHFEKAGRVCYKSANNNSNDSAEKYIRKILKQGHESIIEHISITYKEFLSLKSYCIYN